MNLRIFCVKILYEVFYKSASFKTSFKKILSQHKIKDLKNIIFIKKICQNVIKNKIFIDEILQRLTSKKITNKFVNLILEIAICEIFFSSENPENHKNYAILNEACNSAKYFKQIYATGFINAALRKSLAFDKNEILQSAAKNDDILTRISVRYSYPISFLKYFSESFGLKNVVKFCVWNNISPRLSIRVNDLKTSVQTLKNSFISRGCEIREPKLGVTKEIGFSVIGAKNIEDLREFKNGHFFVQDEVSQLVSLVLGAEDGDFVLDACASPGGKTCGISIFSKEKAKVYAFDISDEKTKKIRENVKRLGLKNIEILTQDFFEFAKNAEEKNLRFDRILVDAPCSGLGVWNKHFEAKFQRSNFAKDLEKFRDLQQKMLCQAAKILKTNGVLVYSVCTFTREETDEVVQNFLLTNSNFKLQNIKEIFRNSDDLLLQKIIDENGVIKILPFTHKMNGFFCAKLEKIK